MKFNYIIFTFLFLFITNTSKAQDLNKIFLEAEAVTKYSVGETKRDVIYYEPSFTIDVPQISTHKNPIYGLNISLNYQLNSNFSAGFGSGLNFVFEQRPDFANEYHTKIMAPFFARFRYQTDLSTNLIFISDINAGYQYVDFKHGNTENGFLFQESGGLLLNLDLGLGLKIAKFTPLLKAGYELNQSNHENSLGWIAGYNYEDKIEYRTYYHLLKLSLSLRL
ncbi:hypothetical protein RM549_05150 [Salegentibacter sp. F188]|uniref:Outer membrane protein beta-barrel domain-containing protein n=1 Tax=Autumnicola patrickiae TaxID=3075591 RepID=A0ABU3DZP0_9FLAO|nr:hypothetical protein [Salegentibacter sp. F188]MDT0689160.1 hypothetical protein [Salegentibacter sp. F188]